MRNKGESIIPLFNPTHTIVTEQEMIPHTPMKASQWNMKR